MSRGGGSRRWSDEELLAAVHDARSIADICRSLGIRPSGGNYEVIRDHAHRLGAVLPPAWGGWARRAAIDRVPSDQFAAAVDGARTLREVCGLLGLSQSGGMTRIAHRRIVEDRLDTSHFVCATAEPGVLRQGRTLDELLRKGVRSSTARLRLRLLREGVKEHRCEQCWRHEWGGVPIPLELDHVNGDRWDNRLENLRLLCPNCHALTPTYRGRNIGRQTGATPA